MHRDLKFKIISEGQKLGVSRTCKKYDISRTLYYRWLKRYKEKGMNGLDEIDKKFTPPNKTASEVAQVILNLIKQYPTYGPREVKYLMDEMGMDISESGVYNVMKRHELNTRKNRLKYAKGHIKTPTKNLPDFHQQKSGECWLFWTTSYGEFEGIGSLYEYTILDYKSRIACSRLYPLLNLENFEDLLTAAAIPVAQCLNFNTQHLCFLENYNVSQDRQKKYFQKIDNLFTTSGFDVKMHFIPQSSDVESIHSIKKEYTHHCLSSLMPYIHQGAPLKMIKIKLQQHIRSYNLEEKKEYDGKHFSPIEYHIQSTGGHMILPLWAYIDRDY